jgi:histidine ammonia-lyase
LAAVQGCDFHAPLKSSSALETARSLLRTTIPALDEDRYFHPDIAYAQALIVSGDLASLATLPGLV